MPKVGMEPIRRQQLIEATITSISRYGYADATISRISKEAGVSTGIVHHYFGSKDDLLEATMRTLLQQLRQDMVDRLATATTPGEGTAVTLRLPAERVRLAAPAMAAGDKPQRARG